MPHFLPPREGDSVNWLNNLTGKIKPTLKALGMSEELADEPKKLADAYIAEIANVNNARAAYRKAVADKDKSKKACMSTNLKLVAMMKTNPLWDSSMSKELQTDYVPNEIDRVNYKPSVTAVLDGGRVRLRINKQGVEAHNIYGKVAGGTEFILLATITRGVWVDMRPLGTLGVAEIRQYRVRGVVADEEIGQFSDIITMSYGG